MEETEKTVTTKELAETLGVSNMAIKRVLEKTNNLNGTVKVGNGKPTVFTENQATFIKQEIQKHHNLASRQIDNVSTELEVIANYKKATEALISMLDAKNKALKAENESQKQRLAEQQPKVDFYNAVTDSGDCIDIGQVAKLLNCGYGRNTLFEVLRKKGVLDKRNQPYQRFVDAGYFRVIESSFVLPNGDQKINLKTVVYQKGVDFIRRVVSE